jgi:hypothetical protein
MKSKRLPGLLLTLAGALLLPPLTGFAQEPDRVIERVPWRTEPIKIIKLKTKNKEVEPGKKFSEADDWLVGLTVTVQNTSNKPIARIELWLAFPPPKGSSPEKPRVADGMIWGQEPATASPSEELKLILPGESVELKLLESNLLDEGRCRKTRLRENNQTCPDIGGLSYFR